MWVSDGDGCAGGEEEKERKTEAKVDGQDDRVALKGLVRNHL